MDCRLERMTRPKKGNPFQAIMSRDGDEGQVSGAEPLDVVVDAEEDRGDAVDDPEVRVEHYGERHHHGDVGDGPRDGQQAAEPACGP